MNLIFNMSKEFFNDNENRDYELFVELMDDVASNTEKGAAPKYCYCDATGKTMGDITIEFELKYRTYNFNEDKMVMEKNGKEYSEIIIEAHKIAELLISNQLNRGTKQKYINFIENDDNTKYAICYDISNLPQHPKKQKFGNIYSKGYEQQEDGWRFLLPIKDAVIFKKENNEKYKKIYPC